MFPFKSEGRKIPIEVSVQMQSESKEFLLLEGGSAFLFYSGLQLIRGGPHTGGRAIYQFKCSSLPKTPSLTDMAHPA